MDNEKRKQQQSLSLVSKNWNIVISTQVINEICFNLIQKAKYSENDVKKLIQNISHHYSIIVLDMKVVLLSSDLRKKYKLSFWDSFIVASALTNHCDILYSEDMQHEQTINGTLQIINPFLQ